MVRDYTHAMEGGAESLSGPLDPMNAECLILQRHALALKDMAAWLCATPDSAATEWLKRILWGCFREHA